MSIVNGDGVKRILTVRSACVGGCGGVVRLCVRYLLPVTKYHEFYLNLSTKTQSENDAHDCFVTKPLNEIDLVEGEEGELSRAPIHRFISSKHPSQLI